MLRRNKDEVLAELPPKRRQVALIDMDDALYLKLIAPAIEEAGRLNQDGLTPSERALLTGRVAERDRQATGIAKAPYVAAFVKALLEGGERVLLFAHHHNVMDIYKKAFKNYCPSYITGREDDRQKDAGRCAFMEGRTPLCVISLRAAAGLNLQRATCVVFGELDWSPAVHSQAEDRAHRIGQRDSVMCYYLVAPEGCDQVMQEALGLKVSQFVQLMGDAPKDMGSPLAQTETRLYVEKIAERLRSMG